jgi:hypothetical protein
VNKILKAFGFTFLGIAVLLICYFLFAVYMHKGLPNLSSVSYETTFSENASGGTLLFVRPDSRIPRFVSIETQPNESPSSVVDRLTGAILHSDVFFDVVDYMTEEELELEKQRYVNENTLRLPYGIRYYFAGTETGLGIPRSVTSVNCSFDSSHDLIDVFWKNPSLEEYDRIKLYFRWTNLERGRPELHVRQDQVGGTVSNFSLRRVLFSDLPPINIDDLDVLVVGYKNGIPSNATGVHFCNSTNTQQELNGISFANTKILAR